MIRSNHSKGRRADGDKNSPRASAPVEHEGAWPRQGEWTYEDYRCLLDDGRRYEIIEGVLYVVNAPSYDHQFTVSELHL